MKNSYSSVQAAWGYIEQKLSQKKLPQTSQIVNFQTPYKKTSNPHKN